MLSDEIRKLVDHLTWAAVGNHTVEDRPDTAFKLAAALLQLEKQCQVVDEELSIVQMESRERGKEIARLRALLLTANNAMALQGGVWIDPGEVEHQIECHAATLPEYTRTLAAALRAAQEVVSPEVADMVEHTGPYRDKPQDS